MSLALHDIAVKAELQALTLWAGLAERITRRAPAMVPDQPATTTLDIFCKPMEHTGHMLGQEHCTLETKIRVVRQDFDSSTLSDIVWSTAMAAREFLLTGYPDAYANVESTTYQDVWELEVGSAVYALECTVRHVVNVQASGSAALGLVDSVQASWAEHPLELAARQSQRFRGIVLDPRNRFIPSGSTSTSLTVFYTRAEMNEVIQIRNVDDDTIANSGVVPDPGAGAMVFPNIAAGEYYAVIIDLDSNETRSQYTVKVFA